jgi:hypothetical protein
MVLVARLENDYHHREVEYQRQLWDCQNTIAELQQDNHRLNNIINPIPLLGAAEMDPAVIVADDDMEVDVEEKEDLEELMPIDEDDDVGGNVSGVDSDHDN